MTTSRRNFLKLFGAGAAAIVVAPHIEVSEVEASEPEDTVVEQRKLHPYTAPPPLDSDFQTWLGSNDGPVTVLYGVRCLRIPAGFTVAEIREKLNPIFNFPSEDLEAWSQRTSLSDNHVMMGGRIEFVRRVREKRSV